MILSAAFHHDIGIKEAERKHSSTGAEYRHLEGLPAAHRILIAPRAPDEPIEEVCDIIGHRQKPGKHETYYLKRSTMQTSSSILRTIATK